MPWPTTADKEREFSLGKLMLPDNRKRMQPILIKALMMLLVNKDWWDLPFFEDVYRGKWDDDMRKAGCDMHSHKKIDEEDVDVDMMEVDMGYDRSCKD